MYFHRVVILTGRTFNEGRVHWSRLLWCECWSREKLIEYRGKKDLAKNTLKP